MVLVLLFCYTILSVLLSFAIILTRESGGEGGMPWVCLQFIKF